MVRVVVCIEYLHTRPFNISTARCPGLVPCQCPLNRCRQTCTRGKFLMLTSVSGLSGYYRQVTELPSRHFTGSPRTHRRTSTISLSWPLVIRGPAGVFVIKATGGRWNSSVNQPPPGRRRCIVTVSPPQQNNVTKQQQQQKNKIIPKVRRLHDQGTGWLRF